jgi:glycosyltransferase involved in cell wall biosynthesis
LEKVISIIIPVYNIEKLRINCFESVMSQTYPNLEIIAVDDKSTDNSLVLLQDYARQDERIKVIALDENKGQSNARNIGIAAATGDYITLVDSDDFIKRDLMEVLLRQAEKSDADVSIALVKRFVSSRDTMDISESYQQSISEKTYTGDDILTGFIYGDGFGRGPYAKIIKTYLLQDIMFEVGRLHEDNYWNYQIFEKSKKVILTQYFGYFYVDNMQSTTKSTYSDRHLDKISEEQKIVAAVKQNRPDLVDQALDYLAHNYYWVYKKIYKDFAPYEVSAMRKHRKLVNELYDHEKKQLFTSPNIKLVYRIALPLFRWMPVSLLSLGMIPLKKTGLL